VSATTYVVRPDGTGDFPTIQAAVEAASHGDVIELTHGTFTGEGNRDVDYLGKAVTVRSQDANPETCIIDCEGSAAAPHRGFLISSGEPEEAMLIGVTIVNGWITSHPHGGAILCDGGSSPEISSCIFLSNRTAAIFCTGASSPTIRDCLFLQNAGGHGGGISSEAAFPSISRCEFVENSAGDGGGIHGHAARVSITECTFTGNSTSGWGGAIGLLYGCSGTVHDCLFLENSAQEAGAINLHFATASIRRCTFVDNSAMFGGAMCTSKMSEADLTGCTFWGNTAAGGAALYCGERVVNIDHTVIAFNNGGAAVVAESTVKLTCCDIFGNEGGDWVGAIAGQYGINGNICEDPLFCDPQNGDFELDCASPCAPFTAPNPECDQIGAWPVGCGGSPARGATWGFVKGLFRGL
jgi:hypothetical protein